MKTIKIKYIYNGEEKEGEYTSGWLEYPDIIKYAVMEFKWDEIISIKRV